MNLHSCGGNPSSRSTSSSVVRTTLFVEWNCIHSALDTDDIDKWGCRLENETKGKTLNKTHYRLLFWRGWNKGEKGGAVSGRCSETDATIQYKDGAAQQSDNFKKQFHLARHPIGTQAREPMTSGGLFLSHFRSYRKDTSRVVIWKNIQRNEEFQSTIVVLRLVGQALEKVLWDISVHGQFVLWDTDEKNPSMCPTTPSISTILHSKTVRIITLSRYCANFAHMPLGGDLISSFTAVASHLVVYFHKWLLINQILLGPMLRTSEL